MTPTEVRVLFICGILVLNAVIVWRIEHPGSNMKPRARLARHTPTTEE